MSYGDLIRPPDSVLDALDAIMPPRVTCYVYEHEVRTPGGDGVTTFFRLVFRSPTPPHRVTFTECDLDDDGAPSEDNGRSSNEQVWRWLLAKAKNHFATVAAADGRPRIVDNPFDFPAKTAAQRAREKAASIEGRG